MNERISFSASPAWHWSVFLLSAILVVGLTIWPYWRRLVESNDRRKYGVIILRFIAVLCALLAMLRPSVLLMEKAKQKVSVVFLLDRSTSMTIQDEVNNSSRWDRGRDVLARGEEVLSSMVEDITVKIYQFDRELISGGPPTEGEGSEPIGQQTAIGANLLEPLRLESGAPIASMILISDGAQNQGTAPTAVAQELRARGIPITTVGLGSQSAGSTFRDLAVVGLRAPEAVFVKNTVEVRGVIRSRGLSGKTLQVELVAEGNDRPVARAEVTIPDDTEVISTPPLRFTPEAAGEKLLSLRVSPEEGELIASNNTYSTFLTVLPGGLNVLHLQGPGSIWEGKYLTRALDASREIESQLVLLLGQDDRADEFFEEGKYNVYVLGDIAARSLTTRQHQRLARAVQQGAGLIMLGGRDSFGPGGWGSTPLADVMPTLMNRNDRAIGSEGEGVKLAPVTAALDNYVLQVAPTTEETAALWNALPPMPGANEVGNPKEAAAVWAESTGGRPLMVALDGAGRTIAFGGSTWTWFRGAIQAPEARDVHRKFWRQVILWLAHQEDRSDSGVDLKLDRRRLPLGDRLNITATARDDEGRPVRNAVFDANVKLPDGSSISLDLVNQGDDAGGFFEEINEAGVFELEVVAREPNGSLIGRSSSRFLGFEDDRELANPSANIGLLQQIAELTGGEFLRPEELNRFLNELDPEQYSRIERQREYRIWDNWPFLITFVGVLGVEWWLRKRMGWV